MQIRGNFGRWHYSQSLLSENSNATYWTEGMCFKKQDLTVTSSRHYAAAA